MSINTRTVDAYLDGLVASNHITEPGRQWLVAALDPFHDTDVCCSGLPDTNLAPSIVQLVKQTFSVACPSGVTSGTWDANIVQFPIPHAFQLAATTAAQSGGDLLNIVDLVTSGGVTVGGVSAFTCATGSPTDLTATIVDGACPAQYFEGTCRVIAAGFEVVNTTSDLYAQGQILAYRTPQGNPHASQATYNIYDGSQSKYVGAASYHEWSSWPTTLANAMLLGGTRQWHAKEGVYSVATFSGAEHPAFGTIPLSPMVWPSDPEESGDTNTTIWVPPSFEVDQVATYANKFNHVDSFHMNGAYFTGLSLQTTLNVTVNWYIERFPDPYETDLVVLAKPSPPYDPRAMELYTNCLMDMPPGVPVAENGLGDWIASAFSGVTKFAAPLLNFIPGVGPIASAAASGLGSLASTFTSSKPSPSSNAMAKSYIAPPNTKLPPASEVAKATSFRAQAPRSERSEMRRIADVVAARLEKDLVLDGRARRKRGSKQSNKRGRPRRPRRKS